MFKRKKTTIVGIIFDYFSLSMYRRDSSDYNNFCLNKKWLKVRKLDPQQVTINFKRFKRPNFKKNSRFF